VLGVAAVLVAVLGGGRVARAADAVTPASCIAANEEAGPLRRAGKLRAARAKLRLCSSESCPVVVRKDCVTGSAQADADVPTVAFSVQDPDGNDLSAVHVSLDGQPLADRLDGKAIDVDPGEHVFKFEAAGQPTVEKRIVIIEGEKNRRERVVLGEPKAVVVTPVPVLPPPRPPPPANPKRTAGFLVGAGGLVFVGVGSVFGLVATLQWTNAKNACGPDFPLYCSQPSAANADRAATVRAATAADALLIVGGVAVVTGVSLVILSPTASSGGTSSANLKLTPSLGAGGGGLMLGGAF
jgi:hypothetical protein